MKKSAQIVCGEGPARLEGSGGPDRTGRATETPTRLEDGDLVEAVSRAVLRELEGGSLSASPWGSLAHHGTFFPFN